jgi:hypothetical protein
MGAAPNGTEELAPLLEEAEDGNLIRLRANQAVLLSS